MAEQEIPECGEHCGTCARCGVEIKAKRRTRKQGAEKRVRKTISVAVPQDEQEDGAGVLDDLIQACREQWAEDMGWSSSVPAYYVIVAGLAKALQ